MKAVAPNGRPLRFFNLSVAGGFGAEYAANGEPYNSSICYIDGMKCFAGEARFGGIVIQSALDGLHCRISANGVEFD